MENIEIELKPYYVYELVDGRNNEVFYVGKGTGRRAEQHAKDAVKKDDNTNIERLDKINELGDDLVVRIIGRYDTQAEAFAVEATLIHYVYGYDNLTNIQPGHGSSTIREKGINSKIDGIDIPETKYQNNGEYTNQNKVFYEEYRIDNFMHEVKNRLSKELNIELTDPEATQAFKTVIVKHIIGPFEIHILTLANASKGLTIEIKPKESGKNGREAITQLVNQTEFYGIGLKKDGTFTHAKIKGLSDMTDDMNRTISNLRKIIEIVENFEK